jgi:hypothetical protein
VEVLSVLALATKEIRRGRFSEQIPLSKGFHFWTCCREIRKDIIRRKQDRGCDWRLAQLTDEEARMATTLTLRGVMGGT